MSKLLSMVVAIFICWTAIGCQSDSDATPSGSDAISVTTSVVKPEAAPAPVVQSVQVSAPVPILLGMSFKEANEAIGLKQDVNMPNLWTYHEFSLPGFELNVGFDQKKVNKVLWYRTYTDLSPKPTPQTEARSLQCEDQAGEDIFFQLKNRAV